VISRNECKSIGRERKEERMVSLNKERRKALTKVERKERMEEKTFFLLLLCTRKSAPQGKHPLLLAYLTPDAKCVPLHSLLFFVPFSSRV
jgi:hypothetical protein